ncbi:MAG: hypothetical protein RIB98_11855 [Acidimicrobiales bacterium]
MPVHIARAIRSPFTRVDGTLAGWHPVDLAAEVMKVARGDHRIDEVFVGCAEPVGAQGADMARAAVLAAGWSDLIGGLVIDRAETSATAALHLAAAAIATGAIDTAMVVGVCSASVVTPGAGALGRTYGRPWGDGPAARVEDDGGLLPGPGAADRAAVQAGVGRSAQDDWALAGLERRAMTTAPITPIAARPGDGVAIQRGAQIGADDLRPRPDDARALAPSFDPDGTVTGFTFAPPVDGVAVLVLAREPAAGAEILGSGRSAGHPLDPIGGLQRAVAAATQGIDRASITRWEITEPTAASTLLAIDRLHLDPTQVNRDGGTLAVGDAGAAEELRLLTDAIARADPGELVLAAAFGPSGAAATLVRCP